MSKSRIIVVLGSLGLVLFLTLSWFLLLSPRMLTAKSLDEQRVQVQAQNVQTVTHIAELEAMKENIAEIRAEADALAAYFPPTADEATLFALVKEAAAKAGLPENRVSNLSAGVPTLVAATGGVTLPETAAGAEGELPASDPNAAPNTGEAAPPATPPATGTPASGATGATGAAGAPTGVASQLASMTLDMAVSGDRKEVIKFIRALEDMGRAYLVTSINIGSGDGPTGYTVTITGSMYLLPELADPTEPAEPVQPAIDPATAPATGTGTN